MVTMKRRHIPLTLAALAATCVVGATQAQAEQGKAIQAVAGRYEDGGVDSVVGYYLLPDQSYCMFMSAGMLDLHLAGNWSAEPMGGGDYRVHIDSRALAPSAYVAWINPASKPVKGQTGPHIRFSGRRFSLANDMHPVVFGFGQKSGQPRELAHLFEPYQSSFESSYRLPIPPYAKHVYIGHATAQGLELTEFALPPRNSFLTLNMSFDFNAAYAGKMQAKWSKGVLSAVADGDEETMGRQVALEPREAAAVVEQCVKPVLEGDVQSIFPDGAQLQKGQKRILPSSQKIRRKPWFTASPS